MYFYYKMSTYTDEVWKEIQDFPGYMVSSLGRVRNRKGKILVPTVLKEGYYQLCLWKKGKQIHKLVSRLVAQAFIPNPKLLPTVDHINHDRGDNRVCNLRFATMSQQLANRRRFNNKPTKSYIWYQNKWRAQIQIKSNNYYLGSYETEQEASNIYDFFCWLYF